MNAKTFFALVKVHVTVPPGGTMTLQLVEPIGVKLAETDSLTVYVPGARAVNVALPVPPLVEIVAVAVVLAGPPLSVKSKLPLPPIVFLVTTTRPRATLLKTQLVLAWPAVTTAVHVVEPTGAKSGFADSVTVYVPGASPLNVAVPCPAGLPVVEIVAVIGTPFVSGKTKVPLPSWVFFVTTTEPRAALLKVQDVEPPADTSAVQVVDPTGTKFGLGASVTVYVPGASPLNVAVPCPAGLPVVEIVAVMVTPLVRVKTNVPFPPSVFLVTTTWPRAMLLKVHGVEPPAVTTAVHVVGPTGAKSALAASLTVYVPGASPLNVAVPWPSGGVVVVVEIVAVIVTPLVSVKTNVPFPPSVFLVTTTWPRATLVNTQLVLAWPAVTTAVQVVGPTGAKAGFAASVTVYVPGARPA